MNSQLKNENARDNVAILFNLSKCRFFYSLSDHKVIIKLFL